MTFVTLKEEANPRDGTRDNNTVVLHLLASDTLTRLTIISNQHPARIVPQNQNQPPVGIRKPNTNKTALQFMSIL